MSTKVARGGFASNYIVTRPRPRVPGIGIAMAAMIVLLLAALAANLHGWAGGGDSPGADTSDVLLLGP